jgi:hypothetical protein
MKILNHNQAEFCVAHFQGHCASEYPSAIEHFQDQYIVLPENLEIVTVTNQPEDSMLIKQLIRNNIPFHNKAIPGGYWNNLMKIDYIREALEEVKSEYVLILDAGDVLLNHKIKDILQRFLSYKKKLIFGATKNNYPNILVDKIHDRDFRGEFRYFNAGTCLGFTTYCREFYLKASHVLAEDKVYNPAKSEQLIIRHIFKDTTEDVDFDYRSELFQTFNRTILVESENQNYLVI